MNIHPTSTRTRRSTIAATILGGVLLAAGCGNAPRGEVSLPSFGTDGATTSLATDTTIANSSPDPAPTNPPADDAGEDALDQDDDSHGYPDGEGGGGGGQPDGGGRGGELEPFGDQPPAPGPCDDVLATGAVLLVAPEPAVLPSGTMSSALTVTNCGDEAVDWTAATIPNVTLDNAGGNLNAWSSSELGFTIDSSAYEPGAVSFKIKVSEAGHNHYVDVHAFRELVGSDLVGDLGLSAGDEAGGCANQCITSARLTANMSSPNVTLEVGTNTPAVINVYVSEQAPGEQDGHPDFPGVDPVATSGGETTNLTTPVSPLNAATKYHIIVEATDANDNSSYQSGSFTTMTPVEQPEVHHGGGAGSGCASQCITLARVTPLPDFHETRIEVETDEWAVIDVWVSSEVNGVNQTPNFDGDPIATTDPLTKQQWDTVITGLLADTEYQVLVKATDPTGNSSYRSGTFHTAAGPQIMARFHAIHVVGDGDVGGKNRGELSFRWGFGDVTLGSRGEERIHSGRAFRLTDNLTETAFIINDDGGPLPIMYVSGSERDPDGLVESCQWGTGVFHESGSAGGCDAKWNSANSGSITSADFDDMVPCSQFELPAEFADQPCLALVSRDDLSDDYPVFWVVVSFQVVE